MYGIIHTGVCGRRIPGQMVEFQDYDSESDVWLRRLKYVLVGLGLAAAAGGAWYLTKRHYQDKIRAAEQTNTLKTYLQQNVVPKLENLSGLTSQHVPPEMSRNFFGGPAGFNTFQKQVHDFVSLVRNPASTDALVGPALKNLVDSIQVPPDLSKNYHDIFTFPATPSETQTRVSNFLARFVEALGGRVPYEKKPKKARFF